jgi:hypothetical protein
MSSTPAPKTSLLHFKCPILNPYFQTIAFRTHEPEWAIRHEPRTQVTEPSAIPRGNELVLELPLIITETIQKARPGAG